MQILDIARKTMQQEIDTLEGVMQALDEQFVQVVELLHRSKGRVVITGIGKSALIAQKIVGTLNSTGTPAIFMHAADAIHGDLGIVQKNDTVICLSKSGNTPEVKVLVPLIRQAGNTLIALVSENDSYLAKSADYVIFAPVDKEACPYNLTPTSSSTAHLVLGDALAICLLEKRGFTAEDFARYHPGGTLGKRLYLRVSDLYTQNPKPYVYTYSSVKDVIIEMSKKRMGATAVLNENEDLSGIITDGDLRRMLERNLHTESITAGDIMGLSPKTIPPDMLAIKAFEMMKENSITQLLVAEDKQYYGVVHLHDLLREGIF